MYSAFIICQVLFGQTGHFACTAVALKTLILVERVFLRVRIFIAGISRHVESLILVLLR